MLAPKYSNILVSELLILKGLCECERLKKKQTERREFKKRGKRWSEISWLHHQYSQVKTLRLVGQNEVLPRSEWFVGSGNF